MGSPLSRWLATLDVDRLTDLLERRPEALYDPVPHDVPALAARLQERGHVIAALQALPLPGVQVIEVMQGFGGPSVGRDQLAAALGRPADDPGLAATLQVLAQRALVWPDGAELRMAGPLWTAFPYPLGLGTPAAKLLDRLSPTELRAIAKRLEVQPEVGRHRLVEAIAGRLGDADLVRRMVEASTPATRTLLDAAAWRGPLVPAPMRYSGTSRDLPPGAAYAAERGLLLPDGWDHLQLPGEVGMALRGPHWRAPFDPGPPALDEVTAAPDAVAREAAAAAGGAVGHLSSLLDECARTPVALLKTGGVGTREARRLARVVGCGEPEVRLWLELSYAAGLIGVADGCLLATEAYDAWAALDAAPRLAQVLPAWLTLPAAPLADRPGGAAVAVLTRDQVAVAAPDVRADLLRLVADLPDGHGAGGPAAVAAAVRWRSPLTLNPPDAAELLVRGLWQEAHLVGALAHGALTPLGRALLAGDGVLAAADALLPAAVREALFQADLTAVVPGLPAASLAALLDAAADRESRGGATTWRFTASSVRAALDTGRTGPELLDELRAVAPGDALPQVLEYLVADVARRHGAVRVRAVGCVVRADDPALLAEITGVRGLRPLGLTLLAPTVLASTRPVAETLEALRTHGYAPVGEDHDGTTKVDRIPRPRAPGRPRLGTPPRRAVRTAPNGSNGSRGPRGSGGSRGGPGALARALLAASRPTAEPASRPTAVPASRPTAGGPVGAGALAEVIVLHPRAGAQPVVQPVARPVARPGDVSQAIRTYAAHLSGSERSLLARSIKDGSAVRIDYTNSSGRSSRRVIEPLDLERHLLTAWCHLRDEERMFSLDRIDAVARA